MQIVFTVSVETNTEALIAMANALSYEIDRLAEGPALQYPLYAARLAVYNRKFDALCKALESRGIVVPDRVRCPE